MQSYPSYLLENAVNQLAKLPGIGRRSALRLALFLLKQDKEMVDDFAKALMMLKSEVKYCECCKNISDTDICSICADESRDKTTVCVVETIRELMLVEQTGQFKGLYHVLGGVVAPMEGVHPSDLEIESLVKRVESGTVKEVILALSTTTEGDTTSLYIVRKLSAFPDVSITTIARGVAIGDELQYADELTLGKSILNRIPYIN